MKPDMTKATGRLGEQISFDYLVENEVGLFKLETLILLPKKTE